MRSLIIAIAILLSAGGFAQKKIELPGTFVRVYDLNGKKLAKGKIVKVSKTSLELDDDRTSKYVPYFDIGTIKTKHTTGHNILIGSVIGAVAGGVVVVATDSSGSESTPASSDFGFQGDFEIISQGSMAAAGVVLGGLAGAAAGGLTTVFKFPKSFEINGEQTKWEEFLKLTEQ